MTGQIWVKFIESVILLGPALLSGRGETFVEREQTNGDKCSRDKYR